MNWSQRQTASSATHGNRQWRDLRARRLQLDRFQCQLRLQGVCIGTASEVDVIIPIAVTGPRRLTLDDVQSVCAPCHSVKTAGEANAKRGRRTRRQPVHPADTLRADYRP